MYEIKVKVDDSLYENNIHTIFTIYTFYNVILLKKDHLSRDLPAIQCTTQQNKKKKNKKQNIKELKLKTNLLFYLCLYTYIIYVLYIPKRCIFSPLSAQQFYFGFEMVNFSYVCCGCIYILLYNVTCIY